MATSLDSYTATGAWTSLTGDTSWRFQTFTIAGSGTFTPSQIKLHLGKANNPTGNVTVGIRAVDAQATPEPTGADLFSATIACASLTAIAAPGGAVETLTFTSPTALNLGTRYAIVVRVPNQGGADTVYWRMDVAGTYANGNAGNSGDAGVNWNTDAAQDNYFNILGAGGAATAPVDKTYSKKLVTACNNEIWYESSAGTMTELTAANGDIDTTKPLRLFEYDEKVFVVNGSNLKVIDFGNVKITTADIVGGGDPPDFHTILTGGTSGAKMILDYTTAITGAATLYGKRTTTATFQNAETVTGTDDDGNAVSFVLNANETAPTTPHWYNWTVFGNDSSYGAMPDQANEGCNYRGRPVLTQDKFYSHQWYMGRQRNPWDWNYVANDAGSPIKGGNSDAKEIGDIVIVAIPYKDDYLIWGCANTLWYLVGDAAERGVNVELDLTNGILGSRAWCWDGNDNLYILGTTGILKIPKGFGAPENLTSLSYPNFIEDLAYDPSSHRIVMGYDRVRHGLRISKTTLTDGTNTGWWYDFRTEGLFPETYPEECGPFCMFYYESIDATYRGLLEGDNDGYIRQVTSGAVDDDIGGSDEAIDSYYTVGPIAMGKEDSDGIFMSLRGTPAGGLTTGSLTDSSDIAYKIWTAQTADEINELLLANTSPKVSGTISALGSLKGSRKRRKIRGRHLGIRVGNNTTGETWALEKLQIDTRPAGRSK